MLRPGDRLLGSRHLDGDAAVRRRRLCSTRKVISAQDESHKRETRQQEDGQLDFDKMPLNQSRRGRGLFARKHKQFGPPPPLRRSPFTSWTVQQRFTITVVVSTWKEAPPPGEPIATCMTPIGGSCCRLYQWDYFFSLSSKCNIFLLITRNTREVGAQSDSSCCYLPYDFGPHRTVNIHVASR